MKKWCGRIYKSAMTRFKAIDQNKGLDFSQYAIFYQFYVTHHEPYGCGPPYFQYGISNGRRTFHTPYIYGVKILAPKKSDFDKKICNFLKETKLNRVLLMSVLAFKAAIQPAILYSIGVLQIRGRLFH